MHRPGVDYWADTRSSTQHGPITRRRSNASSGPPSLSQTFTADFNTSSNDVPHTRAVHGLGRRGSTGSPSLNPNGPPSSPIAGAAAPASSLTRDGLAELAELETTKTHVTKLLQQQREEEERVSRMQATWRREGVEYANALKTLQASLEREHVLRATTEQARHNAVRECQQLRAALRALLANPLSPHGTTSGTVGDVVPLALYEAARGLLLRCERAFAELKMLQLRATSATGLERLRCYAVPLLDGIPPAWPPVTPPKAEFNTKIRGGAQDSLSSVQRAGSDAVVFTPRQTVAAPSQIDETPTGPEVSALTTVSPDTPCSGGTQERPSSASHSLYPSEQNASLDGAEVGEAQPAVAGAAPSGAPQSNAAAHNGMGGGARRVLLSPSFFPPSADVSNGQQTKQDKTAGTDGNQSAEAGVSGPMHAFAADGTSRNTAAALASAAEAMLGEPPHTGVDASAVPSRSRLRPLPGSQLSEFERENIIFDTDQLIRQLSRETVALAKSDGVRSSTDVAALCRRRGLDYVDAAFLPVTETLGLASGGCRVYDPDQGSSYIVQWCTRDAFLPKGRRAQLLTSAGVDPNALRCGCLGDTGVAAALAALAEAAGAVVSVLASTTTAEEENGIYVVWLCVRGWWTRVTMDAYLPCLCEPDHSVTLYGCRNASTYDLWPPVCEKALAKVYGSYQALPHLSADVVLGHLTGGPVEHWDWWRRCSDTALEEIEAAINTNARGAGIVLLTTHSAAALRWGSLKGSAAGVPLEYERLGLLPGTSYRVLAMTENADGESLLLLRNWAKVSSSSNPGESVPVEGRERSRCDLSPLHDDESAKGPMLGYVPNRHDAAVAQYVGSGSSAATSESEGCIWLSYTRQILPLFDQCHACFDCRRFHDVRFPIHFEGTAPAVPTQLIRVRVQDRQDRHTRSVTLCPTRLWIGMHQPGFSGQVVHASGSWSLKLTLVGEEDASVLYQGGGGYRQDYSSSGVAPVLPSPHTRPARRSYILSESFMGEPKTLPAVWMYLELDPDDLTLNTRSGDGDSNDATTMEFFVLPQMELSNSCTTDHIEGEGVRGGLGGDRGHSNGTASKGFTHPHTQEDVGDFRDEPMSAWTRPDHSSSATTNTEFSFGSHTVAIVAVLAEHKDSVAVDVVEAPSELRAAIYHDVVDRIDFSECAPLLSGRAGRRRPPAPPNTTSAADFLTGAMDVRCQVNGRCLATPSW